MKKQYVAPSVEIELQGISAFCAGCADEIFMKTLFTEYNAACIEIYNRDILNPDLEEAICYNAPANTYVITTS